MRSTNSLPVTLNCAVLSGIQTSSSGLRQPVEPFASSTPITSNGMERITLRPMIPVASVSSMPGTSAASTATRLRAESSASVNIRPAAISKPCTPG
jgi:hypothetical protein